MSGVWALQVLTYLAILVCLVVIVRKTIRYATAPMHLRWEIYPVPHEVGKEYGGSYLEETDWWTKPRHTSLVNEVKAMVPEMLLIETLWKHNRPMWFVSFPFHGGIYVSVGFVVLLIIGGIAQAAGGVVDASVGGLGTFLHYLTIVVGVIGMVSVAVGALGLLAKRSGEELRAQSAPADYFNLVFILLIAVVGLVAWATVDSSFSEIRSFMQGLVSLNPPDTLAGAVIAEVVLISLWLLYMPFTHMTHFVGKYFTYHTVRWEDAPNLRGSKLDQELGQLLQRRVSWAAPHIGEGTWVEVATREVTD